MLSYVGKTHVCTVKQMITVYKTSAGQWRPSAQFTQLQSQQVCSLDIPDPLCAVTLCPCVQICLQR